MRTELINEIESMYLHYIENEDEDFFEIDNPMLQNYIKKVESLTDKEMEVYLERLNKHSQKTLQDIRDNIAFTVPKGFWKKD